MTWAIDEKGYSQRRACALIGMASKTYRYTTSRGDDREFRERLRHRAAERRRFGYRRLHILLRREGIEVNHKKLFRIYREERLAVRLRGGRKRALSTRAPMRRSDFLESRACEAGLFGAQDGRASINFSALHQLIKA